MIVCAKMLLIILTINLYNLYQKSSVWCFAFSHTSTFELIPQSPRLCHATPKVNHLLPVIFPHSQTLPPGHSLAWCRDPVMVDSSDSTDVDLFTRRFIYNIYSDAHTVVNAVKLIVFSSTSFHVDCSETFSPLFSRSARPPTVTWPPCQFQDHRWCE